MNVTDLSIGFKFDESAAIEQVRRVGKKIEGEFGVTLRNIEREFGVTLRNIERRAERESLKIREGFAKSFKEKVSKVGDEAKQVQADRAKQLAVEKNYYATKTRFAQLSTQQLVAEKVSLENKLAVIREKYRASESVAEKKRLAELRANLKLESQIAHSELRSRPDVQRQGAGVGAGILGTGRNIITQSGLPAGGLLMQGGGIAGVALAAVAGIKESISAFSSYEDALADLSAITGVSGGKLNFLGESARRLSVEFGSSAPEAVEAFKLVVSALGTSVAKDEKALADMGHSVMLLAKAAGTDAQTAASALNNTLTQFGLNVGTPADQAKEFTRITNVLSAAAKEGAAEVPDLAAAMKEVGATAKNQGQSVEQAAAAIEVLAMRGLKGAEAGTAYRNVLTFMASGTKEAEGALKRMGLTFADINPVVNGQEKALRTLKDAFDKIKDPVAKAAALQDIFKRENQNAALVLMENVDALGQMTKAITGTNTASEQAATRMSTLSAKWDKLTAVIKDGAIALGQALAPVLDFLLNILGASESIEEQVNKAKRDEVKAGMTEAEVYALAEKKFAEMFSNERVRARQRQAGKFKEILDAYMSELETKNSEVKALEAEAKTTELFFQEGQKLRKKGVKSLDDAIAQLKKENFFIDESARKGLEKAFSKVYETTAPEVDTKKAEKALKDKLNAEELALKRSQELERARIDETVYNENVKFRMILDLEESYLLQRKALYSKYNDKEKLDEINHAIELFNIRNPRGGVVTPAPSTPVTFDKYPLPFGQIGGGTSPMDEQKSKAEELDVDAQMLQERYAMVTDTISNAFTSAWQTINSGFFENINNALNASQNAFGAFVSSIIQQLVQLVQQMIAKAAIFGLLNILSGGGFGKANSFFEFISGFGGGKAAGGSLRRGKWYITGENAPEIIDYTGSTPNVVPLQKNNISSSFVDPFGGLHIEEFGGKKVDRRSLRIGGFSSLTNEEGKNVDRTSLRIGGFSSYADNPVVSSMNVMMSNLLSKINQRETIVVDTTGIVLSARRGNSISSSRNL